MLPGELTHSHPQLPVLRQHHTSGLHSDCSDRWLEWFGSSLDKDDRTTARRVCARAFLKMVDLLLVGT